MRYLTFFIIIASLLLTACNSRARTDKTTATTTKTDTNPDKYPNPNLEMIRLPEGFHISMYYPKVENARSLALGTRGTVFVGTREKKVYALVDEDKDGFADKIYTIADNMTSPNGVAFKDGSLYVAEISRVWRYDNIEDHLADPPKPVLVTDRFSTKDWHGWKYIAFGPDGKLYIPVGAPCNACETDQNKFGNMNRMNADGSGFEVYAKGIRNTVGFDWHPVTKELWFTDNGRDEMGDDIPADELNHAPKPGMNFGFPYCHQGDIPDPVLGRKHDCKEFTPPVQKLGAHVASLGMKFYTGKMFPASYKNQVFIAEHGSWNRSSKVGYRVTLVKLEGDKAVSYEPFAYGWLQGEKAWGRPVDVLVMPDGSLLVSDDYAGCVYRVRYEGKK
jgi:glucose/arabinose dehydrogenase